MISVDVFDNLYPEERTPFVAVPIRNEELYFRLAFDGVTVYLSRARLAELNAVTGAALAANPEAPEAQAPDGTACDPGANAIDMSLVYEELA